MRRPRRQRGVALLAAIVVIALATVLVVGLLDRGEQSRARTRNVLRAEQTWQLLRGAELWAGGVLRRDLEQTPGIDARGDAWGQPLPPIAVPGGTLSGLLRDASGCLDLNRLASEASAATQLARLRRLLLALKRDPDLAEAIADFIDADADPRPRGGEDAVYLRRQPAYRAANRPLLHLSELRLVQGIDGEIYAALRPHVCVLPQPAPLNLNFASPQVWMSLHEDIGENAARQLWRDGQARYGGFEAVRRELDQLGIPPFDASDLGTESQWFVLDAELAVDGLPFQYAVLLQRDTRGVRSWARLRGRW
jgi:general secretion pathway protein K